MITLKFLKRYISKEKMARMEKLCDDSRDEETVVNFSWIAEMVRKRLALSLFADLIHIVRESAYLGKSYIETQIRAK